MTMEECEQEKKQLDDIEGIKVSKVGFVSIEGFSMKKTGKYILIDGRMLY